MQRRSQYYAHLAPSSTAPPRTVFGNTAAFTRRIVDSQSPPTFQAKHDTTQKPVSCRKHQQRENPQLLSLCCYCRHLLASFQRTWRDGGRNEQIRERRSTAPCAVFSFTQNSSKHCTYSNCLVVFSSLSMYFGGEFSEGVAERYFLRKKHWQRQ